MLNSDKLRFDCTRCGNCCTDRNTLVNITYFDILRIINGLSLTFPELFEIFGFYIYNKSLTTKDLEKMVISPIQTEKGSAFIGLMKNDKGVCYLYDQTKKKCLIYELRPMFCRSFPFSFNISYKNNKTRKRELEIIYTEKAKKYCPGIGKDAPFVDIDNLNELARKTLRELKNNYNFNEKWNRKVLNKQLVPTAKNFLRIIFEMREEFP